MSKSTHRPHIGTHRPLINYNSIFAIKNERSVFRQLIKTGKQGVFVFNYLLSIKELSLRNGLGMRKTIPSTLYQRYGLDMALHHRNDTVKICGRRVAIFTILRSLFKGCVHFLDYIERSRSLFRSPRSLFTSFSVLAFTLSKGAFIFAYMFNLLL